MNLNLALKAVVTFDMSLCRKVNVQFFHMDNFVTFATNFQQNSANIRKDYFLAVIHKNRIDKKLFSHEKDRKDQDR